MNNQNHKISQSQPTQSEVPVVCKYCQSANVRKFGKYKDTQLYYCNVCQRKFVPNDTLFHMHTPANQISMTLHSYYTGSSIKTIQDRIQQQFHNKPSTATIFEWITKYTNEAIKATKDYHPQVGDVWVADETFVRVDKSKANVTNPYSKSRKAKWIVFWDIIDADTRFLLASHVTTTRNIQDARILMEKAQKRAGKTPKVVVTDKLKSYIDGIEQSFGADTLHRQTSAFDVKNDNNLIERFHGTLKSRTKVMRALKNKDTLEKFADGWLAHYNFLREHGSLDQTPAEAAKVDYPFRDWADVTHMSHPQVKVLVTPAKVSIINTGKSLRITPPLPKISQRLGRLK